MAKNACGQEVFSNSATVNYYTPYTFIPTFNEYVAADDNLDNNPSGTYEWASYSSSGVITSYSSAAVRDTDNATYAMHAIPPDDSGNYFDAYIPNGMGYIGRFGYGYLKVITANLIGPSTLNITYSKYREFDVDDAQSTQTDIDLSVSLNNGSSWTAISQFQVYRTGVTYGSTDTANISVPAGTYNNQIIIRTRREVAPTLWGGHAGIRINDVNFSTYQ